MPGLAFAPVTIRVSFADAHSLRWACACVGIRTSQPRWVVVGDGSIGQVLWAPLHPMHRVIGYPQLGSALVSIETEYLSNG